VNRLVIVWPETHACSAQALLDFQHAAGFAAQSLLNRKHFFTESISDVAHDRDVSSACSPASTRLAARRSPLSLSCGTFIALFRLPAPAL
jgi:hypothetical protein